MATQEWAPIIAALTAGESLDYGQSYWLMDQVMSGELGEARL
ncbi:MAG: anthranilate phosphoribosyltransferase, partial [Actinomyces sp.]